MQVHVVFARSKGKIRVIIADLLAGEDWWDEYTRATSDFCGENAVLCGHSFHALERYRFPSDITPFLVF
jgi:hypothetical protein